MQGQSHYNYEKMKRMSEGMLRTSAFYIDMFPAEGRKPTRKGKSAKYLSVWNNDYENRAEKP